MDWRKLTVISTNQLLSKDSSLKSSAQPYLQPRSDKVKGRVKGCFRKIHTLGEGGGRQKNLSGEWRAFSEKRFRLVVGK